MWMGYLRPAESIFEVRDFASDEESPAVANISPSFGSQSRTETLSSMLYVLCLNAN